jgi:hypothetical protein
MEDFRSRERERRLEPLLEVEERTPSRIFQRLAIVVKALRGDLLLPISHCRSEQIQFKATQPYHESHDNLQW